MNSNQSTEEVKEQQFPTLPDAEGYYYENQTDLEMGITTKVYENGNKIKSTVLPACGKTAVIRELLARDSKDVARFMDKDPEKYQMASITVATTLDGEKQPIEVIAVLKMKDYSRLLSMYQDLNF